MSVFKCRVPLNVQFEVTYRCNNKCSFCYNEGSLKQYVELDTKEVKSIVKKLGESGVMSLNFNGGEPLIRNDFFDIVEETQRYGLDIHMNTNASLVDMYTARKIAKYFPSICTTILSGESEIHDKLSLRRGALNDALAGINNLQQQSVYVAVNLMLCKENVVDLKNTFDLIRHQGVKSLLVTRYVPRFYPNDSFHLTDNEFLKAVAELYEYQKKYNCFDRIAFPQPYQLCKVDGDLKKWIEDCNIPCNIGLCTASISPNGDMTPCNLVKNTILGNLLEYDFCDLWNKFHGIDYCKTQHLKEQCLNCKDISKCGGGCKGYNSAVDK